MTRNEVLEKILFIITEKLHIDTGVIGEDTLLQDIEMCIRDRIIFILCKNANR